MKLLNSLFSDSSRAFLPKTIFHVDSVSERLFRVVRAKENLRMPPIGHKYLKNCCDTDFARSATYEDGRFVELGSWTVPPPKDPSFTSFIQVSEDYRMPVNTVSGMSLQTDFLPHTKGVLLSLPPGSKLPESGVVIQDKPPESTYELRYNDTFHRVLCPLESMNGEEYVSKVLGDEMFESQWERIWRLPQSFSNPLELDEDFTQKYEDHLDLLPILRVKPALVDLLKSTLAVNPSLANALYWKHRDAINKQYEAVVAGIAELRRLFEDEDGSDGDGDNNGAGGDNSEIKIQSLSVLPSESRFDQISRAISTSAVKSCTLSADHIEVFPSDGLRVPLPPIFNSHARVLISQFRALENEIRATEDENEIMKVSGRLLVLYNFLIQQYRTFLTTQMATVRISFSIPRRISTGHKKSSQRSLFAPTLAKRSYHSLPPRPNIPSVIEAKYIRMEDDILTTYYPPCIVEEFHDHRERVRNCYLELEQYQSDLYGMYKAGKIDEEEYEREDEYIEEKVNEMLLAYRAVKKICAKVDVSLKLRHVK